MTPGTSAAGTGALIGSYDAVVCDLDGVVYRGQAAVPRAPDALQALVNQGVRVLYATNNASRLPGDVADHLRRLGAPVADDDVVTSAEAGAAIVASRVPAGSAVLALGGAGVTWALEQAGLSPVAPHDEAGDTVVAVLQGLGRGLTVADFEVAARCIAAGALWVVTNSDATLPLEWGAAPGNGAYVTLLAASTGQEPAAVAGKPESPLYDLAVGRLGSAPRRTLAVGDRLDTDIAGARAAGLDSAWVLTGVDTPGAVLSGDLSPTYVLASLAELTEPYAAPTRHDGAWRCGAATAYLDRGKLHVDAAGAPSVEAVRAGLGALLEHRSSGEVRADVLRDGAQVVDRLFTTGSATASATAPPR
jgi:glycerol 3-phosphatase-2